MKNILIFLFLALAVGCSKEDPLNAPLGQPKRSYDVNSSDPVKKYVSLYYQNNGKEFLIDADSSDWMYNFNIKNDLKINAPKYDVEHIMAGIELIEEVFTSAYPNADYFPNNLILAESIFLKDTWGDGYNKVTDAVASRSFIAINVGVKGTIFSESDKVRISSTAHTQFIQKYLLEYRKEVINLDKFYSYGTAYYGTKVEDKMTQDELYSLGFIESPSWLGNSFPSQIVHMEQWIKFLFTKPQEEIQTIIDTYPAMKKNYDAWSTEIKEGLGADLKNLVYKAKQ